MPYDVGRGKGDMPIVSAELVIDPTKYSRLEQAERGLYLAFRRLKRRARRYFGGFEYLTFVEISQRGWPRLLLLARGADVPRKWLSENWKECGGARITNVQPLASLARALDVLRPYQFTARRDSAQSRRKTRFSRQFFHDLPADLEMTPNDMAYRSDYLNKFFVASMFRGDSKYRWTDMFERAVRAAQEEMAQ
jgi:hypothetical protein